MKEGAKFSHEVFQQNSQIRSEKKVTLIRNSCKNTKLKESFGLSPIARTCRDPKTWQNLGNRASSIFIVPSINKLSFLSLLFSKVLTEQFISLFSFSISTIKKSFVLSSMSTDLNKERKKSGKTRYLYLEQFRIHHQAKLCCISLKKQCQQKSNKQEGRGKAEVQKEQ
jgi:hypothetical protein